MAKSKVLPCKFCGAKGTLSNQGGINGVPEWEVYVTHKEDCIVKDKEPFGVQDGVSWHSLSNWTNFYSEMP